MFAPESSKFFLREVQPAEVKFKGPACFGERRISSDKKAKPSWAGASGGTIDIDIGKGVKEPVEIHKYHGPKVLELDGSTRFLMEPGKRWASLDAYNQKVLALEAARMNSVMRTQVEAYHQRQAVIKEAEEYVGLSNIEQIKRRCEAEQLKPPAKWTMITAAMVMANHDKVAPGLLYGLDFPWSAETLWSFGPEWLTEAFHAAGTLEKTNAVTEIQIDDKIKIDAGNNAGKFLFHVSYKTPRIGLDKKLFVKCPFAMTKETTSDRISCSVLKQPMDLLEINTYRLIESSFPFKVPKYYYGDISTESSNFILITECIPYTGYTGVSQDAPLKAYEVEGPYDKCKDWQLRGSAKDYYMQIVKAHAMMAGLDKAGMLASRHVKQTGLFYTEPTNTFLDRAWISASPQEGSGPQGAGLKLSNSGQEPSVARSKLNVAINFFSDTAKAIFPEYARSEAFKDKFMQTMMKWNAYQKEIDYWSGKFNPDYAAFGHANLNADNAYFWRNDMFELECGIIDFGGFGHQSIARKIWWTFNCADYENFKDHLDDYLKVFIDTFEVYGGPKLDAEVLKMGFILSCLGNVEYMVAAVPNCLTMCSALDFMTIKDRDDPRISDNVNGKSTLRTTLHVLNNGIRVIEEMKADEVLEEWIQDVYVKKMGGTVKTLEVINIDGW